MKCPIIVFELCFFLFCEMVVWSCYYLIFVSTTPGFDNANGEWDEYPSYVNSEGLEIGSPVRIQHLFLIYLQLLFLKLNLIYVFPLLL